MTKKILVVDDEADIRSMLKTLLEDRGYQVSAAEDGKECLAMLKKSKFDLILIDFFMPEMSGRELAEKIRSDSKLKNLKVVFLTAATFSQAGMKQFDKMDVLDCIKKPFENDDLVKRIKKIIG